MIAADCEWNTITFLRQLCLVVLKLEQKVIKSQCLFIRNSSSSFYWELTRPYEFNEKAYCRAEALITGVCNRSVALGGGGGPHIPGQDAQSVNPGSV